MLLFMQSFRQVVQLLCTCLKVFFVIFLSTKRRMFSVNVLMEGQERAVQVFRTTTCIKKTVHRSRVGSVPGGFQCVSSSW